MNRAVLLISAQNLLISISLIGGRVLLTLYALNIGASAAEVGVVMSVLFIVPAVLSWPIGIMADRLGARWVIGVGQGLNAAAMLVPYFSSSLTALSIGAVGIGVGLCLFNVVGQNVIGVVSTAETRLRNFSNFTLCGAIGSFLGPLMVGFTIDHAGYAFCSLLMAGLSAVGVVLMLAGGAALPRGKTQTKKSGGKFSVLTDPVLRRVLYLSCIGQIGLDAYLTFMPVHAHNVGLSASITGTALAVTGIAVIGMRLWMTRIITSMGEEKVMVGGFLCGAVAFFVLPMFAGATALMVISVIFGLFMGLTQPLILIMMYNFSPPGRSGEALGLRLSVNNAARVISPALFGATARAFGLAPLFIASGALLCLGGYLCRAAHEKGARSA